MKEEALAIVAQITDPAQKLNILREYVQARTLRSLHESEAFVNLSFVGGTALRFVFDLRRFSEDIDFALDNSTGYAPESWMKKLKRDLLRAGFDVSVAWKGKSTVHKAWVKIGSLLQDAGLSPVKDHKLSIKLEIDTNPPAGATWERRLITRHVMLSVKHYDLPSLMAGKVHALMTRPYAKGRDWYDFLWYRGQTPAVEPNLAQLQNALNQTEGAGAVDASRWKNHLRDVMGRLDSSSLAADVRPFLEDPKEADLITAENVRSALA
jgi:predicted nucleotidyltransferase component of viral defense system